MNRASLPGVVLNQVLKRKHVGTLINEVIDALLLYLKKSHFNQSLDDVNKANMPADSIQAAVVTEQREKSLSWEIRGENPERLDSRRMGSQKDSKWMN